MTAYDVPSTWSLMHSLLGRNNIYIWRHICSLVCRYKKNLASLPALIRLAESFSRPPLFFRSAQRTGLWRLSSGNGSGESWSKLWLGRELHCPSHPGEKKGEGEGEERRRGRFTEVKTGLKIF